MPGEPLKARERPANERPRQAAFREPGPLRLVALLSQPSARGSWFPKMVSGGTFRTRAT